MAKKKVVERKEIGKKRVHEDPAGIMVPAGLFLGLGIGGLANAWGAGILIGLGVGLFLLAIIKLIRQ